MDPLEFKKYLRKAFAVYPKISRTDISGFTPSFVVGEKGYPQVRVIFGASERPERLNDLFGRPMDALVENRLMTVGAVRRFNIKDSVREELALSTRPPETEVELKRPPSLRVIRTMKSPFFISSGLKKIDVVSFRIPEKLEKIVSDELKSEQMVWETYRKFGIYKAIDILSAGFTGFDRKMVPSRWAITASDDMVGKRLIKEVMKHKTIQKPEFYYSEYLDNKFLIALLPGVWSFELVEKWRDFNPIHDFEGPEGRRGYARSTEGAYYSARLSVLEHLANRKRQARVVVMRKVGEGYSVPMGVWVIRETVKSSFSKKVDEIPHEFLELWNFSHVRKTNQQTLLGFN